MSGDGGKREDGARASVRPRRASERVIYLMDNGLTREEFAWKMRRKMFEITEREARL